MKIPKALLILVLVIVIAAIGKIGFFYWQNLRGIGPAVRPPSADIAELIEGSASSETPAGQPPGAVNATGMPLTLPPGFSISVFAKGLGKPRVMTSDSNSQLLVSVPSDGKIVLLDYDGKKRDLITGLDRPHGMAWLCEQERCEMLYVAETGKVSEFFYDIEAGKAVFQRVVAQLPSDGYNQHHSRTLMFTPSKREIWPSPQHASKGEGQKLLISVGSSCNVCYEKDSRRAKILSLDLETGELKEYASGLRNSVFMTIHPITKGIWATEMGRDLLGDELPPDEINIVEEGKNYGWPECYGKNILDTDFHKDDHVHIRAHCTQPFEFPSYIDLPAHSAPLGLAFFPEVGWPEEYRHDLLVAYHGSWNRSEPTGYKLVRFDLDAQGNVLGVHDFISGWLTPDGTALGRPVDINILPGGTMYISDDKAGVIYKVEYKQ